MCCFAVRRLHRLHAFTLIELLVVTVILGILMAVAVPTFLRQQTKAQDSRTQQYLTTAFKAIRAGTPDTGNQYPSSTSMVSWITQSEPELTAQRGDCLTGVTSAPTDAVLVDPSSTSTSLQLCSRSQSGNVWKLTATKAGVQQLLDGTLVPLTMSGNEITDATRAAGVQGDGLQSDSSTGIWEATTNLLTNGGFETDNAGWTGGPGGGPGPVRATVMRTTTDAKFGLASAQVVSTGAAGLYFAARADAPISGSTAGRTYTASAWIKGGTNTIGTTFEIEFEEVGGAAGTTAVSAGRTVTMTGQWQRVSLTGTVVQNDRTSLRIWLESRPGSQPASGDYFLADGVQIEQQPYPTPYVETNGAAASRAASRVQVPAALLTSNQFWWAFRVRVGWASSALTFNPRLAAWNTDGSNFFQLQWGRGASYWDFVADIGGTAYTAAGPTQTKSTGDYATVIAQAYGGRVYISVDGASFGSGASYPGLSPTGTSFDIGQEAAANQFDGDIIWFGCGTGTLSDADAATINSWGNVDPKRSSFPLAAQATMVWNGAGSTGSSK